MESEPEHTHTDIDQTEEHCARQLLCLTEQRTREEPQYIHIDQNEFSHRRHKTQTEEDIAICECKYDEHDPESACGERCLNVLTSTECTPGYCPCGVYCKNQRFQKCEYAKTKLFRTEGRGWGLLANENIKAGQFIIEYCGEVISWKEAKQRSQAYEIQGLRDAFIISLNASESIDATEKGSLARFINHSCKPNCETRKWNVLGEIRVGIFAKQDILDGTELAYDYNFEWYGGAKVRCLCGAPSCSGFLGAKSRGFQGETSSRGSGVGSECAMDYTSEFTMNEVDNSTRDSGVSSECVMDYTSEFTTYEIFKTRESLMQWAREAGKRNGFVIVTIRSDLGGKSMKPRVTLGCERGGRFKEKKTKVNKGAKKRCGTGTKKCGCPFTLKGEKLASGNGWMLKVLCGVHNHASNEYSEGRSYAGRLSEQETSLLIDLSKSLVRPKEILNTLKQRDELNATTIRTIYNARQRQRVKEKAGRSQMQQLLCRLNEHDYVEWHRGCPISGNVLDLFWAHPVSLELLRAFPTILMMDCTYKTNRYHYPLLEVVGITSTDITFSVAFVFLDSEKEDNYIWALSRLRGVMVECTMPNVIVTDLDLPLMRAVEVVFPTARHLLCKWHINKNVLSKCKNLFESKEKWDRFIMKWNVLVTSPTESDYKRELAVLQSEFSMYTEVMEYVINTWLKPLKDRFVSAWTDMIMHFGNVTSNRAEGAHSKLKRELGLSQGNFEGSFENIHSLIELQHIDIKTSFDKCSTVVQHNFKSSEFKYLRGVVSIFALEKVLSQSKLAASIGVDALACGCVIRRTHGLPCAHEIAEYKRDCRPIPLESLDSHWTKLDLLPPSSIQDSMDVNEFPELKLLQQYFLEANKDNRLMLRKRVRELVAPYTTTLVEPGIKSRLRGQLKEKIDMSSRRDPYAFELRSASVDSHSPSFTGDTMDVPQNFAHKKTERTKEKVYRTLTVKGISYIDAFPVGLRPFIQEVKDVCHDGHCGFRAVADLVGLGENGYLQVRNDLLTELSSYSAHYGELYGTTDRVRELAQILSFFDEGRAPFDRWMTMPDMGHLIASCYKVVLFHLSATQCLTFLPLRSAPVPLPTRRHIAIGFMNDCHCVEGILCLLLHLIGSDVIRQQHKDGTLCILVVFHASNLLSARTKSDLVRCMSQVQTVSEHAEDGKEDTYLWEDDDDRYSVEKIPLYDSAEDEPSSRLFKTVNSSSSEFDVDGMMINVNVDSGHQLMSTALVVQSLDSVPMEGVVMGVKTEVSEERKLYSQENQPPFSRKNAMISRIRSNTACRNYHIGSGSMPNKRSKQYSNGKVKHGAQKQVDAKSFASLLASREAQEEILKYECMKNDAATHLESLYNEIRPAIEEHERDSQDSVATSVAEKWIEACCLKLKAEFDLYSSIVKSISRTPRRGQAEPYDGNNENEIKYLQN